MSSASPVVWAVLILTGCGAASPPVSTDGGGRDGAAEDAAPADGAKDDDGGRALGPLAPLPPSAIVSTARFTSEEACAFCHATDPVSFRDAAGRDIAPVGLWRASMMAMAARDPYYLTAFAHELEEHPAARDTIEATCTRCHASSASVELGGSGAHLGFDDLVSSTTAEATMGREGVTCTVCHQIRPENLGTDASYTGGFEIGATREIFGPHAMPFERPMVMRTGYTPVHSTHVRESALCATCHTVITRALDDTGAPTGPDFPEQVPYLEWRNSSFDTERASIGPLAASCQDCHVPTVGEDGAPISAILSNRPMMLSPRTPVGRHVFVGANSYMLRVIADNAAWVGTDAPVADILARADLTSRHLASAARLDVTRLEVAGGSLVAEVRVENLTGHKLPTAYPSRRAWLRFEVLDASGATLFVSGAVDARGNLIDAEGRRLDALGTVLPHLDEVTSSAEVQVYQAVMADTGGSPTASLLRASGYAKDDRLLPRGWSASHPDAPMTQPVGTELDPSFVPGEDRVTFRITAPSGAARVRVALLFQSVPPVAVDGLRDHATSMLARFTEMVDARTPVPEILGTVERSLP